MSADSEGPTVVIAEDSALLREGLAGVLERFGFTITAAVATAEGLIAAVDADPPQLVITDVRMPPAFRDEGLQAALELRRHHPALPIVVLSQYIEHTYARELLASGTGAVGYLLKDRVADIRTLVDSLHQVIAGGTVIDPEVVQHLLEQRRDPLSALTPREHETLALMAQGYSNAAIAAKLVVTDATVAKHIRNILDKLDLPESPDHHRRVLAVLTYLQQDDEPPQSSSPDPTTPI